MCARSRAALQGHLHTYRFCDNVWTFFLENATFTLTLGSGTETVTVDKAKIIAVAAAAP
jgi:transcription initiation factor TFIIA small subunit